MNNNLEKNLSQEEKFKILDLITAEYVSLRKEIDMCSNHQYNTLWVSTTAIGTALGAAAVFWESTKMAASLILLVVIPFLVMMFLVLWGNEIARMMRAGEYINFFIEHKIRAIYPDFMDELSKTIEGKRRRSRLDPLENKTADREIIESENVAFRNVICWEHWIRSKGYKKVYQGFYEWLYKDIIVTMTIVFIFSAGTGTFVFCVVVKAMPMFVSVVINLAILIVWVVIWWLIVPKLWGVTGHCTLDKLKDCRMY